MTHLIHLVEKLSGKPLNGLTTHFTLYCQRFLKLKSDEGLKSAISKFKSYYVIAVKISLGLPFEPLKFTRANRLGVPRALIPFYPYLTGGKWSKRIALTLLRIHTLYTLPIDYSVLKNITDPRSKDITEPVNKITAFMQDNLQRLEIKEIREYDASFSIVAGPNGPSVLSAHLDIYALANEGLLGTVRELYAHLKHPLAPSLDRMGTFEPTKSADQLRSGRLSFLQEHGGKTRVIAIVDFWTQQALKVLHLRMMEFIRTLVTDCTFDQNKGFNRVLSKSKGRPCYSYDLSSATDRFPLVLQTELIKCFFGPTTARLWEKLLKRKFSIKHPKGKVLEGVPQEVEWSVGQPLGAYSSWVTFSITHHILIQYIASQVKTNYKGIWSFNDYQILGDDIVIWDKDVAVGYSELLDKLDVKINLDKSIISPEKGSGEFCKRLFLEGVELSPLPLTMIESSLKSIYNLPGLVIEMTHRWKVPEFQAEHWALSAYNITNRDILGVLIGFRHLISGGNAWPWCQWDRTITLMELKKYLIDQQSDMYSLLSSRSKVTGSVLSLPLESIDDLVFAFAKLGIEVSASLLLNEDGSYSEDLHPLILCFLYHHKLQANPGTHSEQGFVNLTDAGAYKSMRHIPSASLDLFFLKTKRRRIKETGQIAVNFYYKKYTKGGLFPSTNLN